MSIINEDLAKRSKENMSFSDYKTGSATAEYNQVINEVAAKIEKAKTKVSPEGQERLEKLFNWYKNAYATWINKYNSNGASHVSGMISGPSGFNHRQHEKYLNREGKLWQEYDELKNIDHKISAIVAGDKIIKSDDPDAVEKLKEKLEKLEKLQESMKAVNAILRKKKLSDIEKVKQFVLLGYSESAAQELLKPDFCGRIGFTYQLSNNNGNIHNVKQRIEKLQRERKQETKEIIINTEEETTEEGIRVVDNPQANRVQIFFPGKPSAELRTELKRNGFRWTPSIGAWQSYRNYHALEKAQNIAAKY